MKLSRLIPPAITHSLRFLLIAVFPIAVFAMDLATAKEQGLVGEGNNGYVAYVITPASSEVTALVEDVNSKRKTVFESTAQKNNINIDAVTQRFYERAITATMAGRYYQDNNGKWIKK